MIVIMIAEKNVYITWEKFNYVSICLCFAQCNLFFLLSHRDKTKKYSVYVKEKIVNVSIKSHYKAVATINFDNFR